MKSRILTFLLALAFAVPASAQLRKYGQGTIVYFPLIELAGVNFATSAPCATGDVKISKDGGAFANTTNCFTAISGTQGGYALALTAAEMSAASILITVRDQTNPKVWLDDSIAIDTYGNSLAQHAMDLDSEAFLQSQRTIYRGTINDTDFAPSTTQFEADLIDPTGATADLSSPGVPDGANRLNARVIVFTSGDLAGTATTITDFVMANGRGRFSVSGVTETPADGSTFVIF